MSQLPKLWGRALGIGAGIGAGTVALGAGAAVLGGIALARRAVTPEESPEEGVLVHSIERLDGQGETGEAGGSLAVRLVGEGAELPGQYSLLFDHGAGHARVGEVIRGRSGPGELRKLVSVDRGKLLPGTRGRLTGWWYATPEELGLRTERITYETELGPAEAWLVRPKRARKRRWAVHVHGRGALPEETLRGVAPLARAGITSLVISYRNDPHAPSGAHGRYGIGLAERRDVDAAIGEALSRGAERITLFGWSMGGTASLLSATVGEHRDALDGLILDSPAIDWVTLLRYHAAGAHAPRLLADIGIGLLTRGMVKGGESGGISFDSLDAEFFARNLRVPALIHASRGDTYVPCGGAERLAQLAPDLVQLRLQESGEHVRLWNVDPVPWEARTERFVRDLPRPGWRG